jgi:hypothetical protein
MSTVPLIASASIPSRLRAHSAKWVLNRLTAIAFGCLLVGSAVGYYAGHRLGFQQAADRRRELPNGSILCKPGPWGDLSYIPFTIAAPDDLLPVRIIENGGTHWLFKGYTDDSFVTLLQSTSLTPDEQHAWLDPAVYHLQPDGVELAPTPDMVISLPDDARARFYQVLAQFPENQESIQYIPKDTLDDRFSGSGVSAGTLDLFKHLSCENGNYLVFSGLPALLSKLPTYEEKLGFLKALTRQRTMLLRLHVTPKSDIAALTAYWGKGAWNTDVTTILQSLTSIQNGTWMNILMVLPPLPTAEIYDYPSVADNPLDGPPVNRDCHWTSLNFFFDVPNPNFGKPEYVREELKNNYYPATGDPRYGDVVLFTKPDGSIIHSAVYIADDICFTKNGGTVIYPWMLAPLSDLLEQYNFQAGPGQQLTVTYFRNKRL